MIWLMKVKLIGHVRCSTFISILFQHITRTNGNIMSSHNESFNRWKFRAFPLKLKSNYNCNDEDLFIIATAFVINFHDYSYFSSTKIKFLQVMNSILKCLIVEEVSKRTIENKIILLIHIFRWTWYKIKPKSFWPQYFRLNYALHTNLQLDINSKIESAKPNLKEKYLISANGPS